MKDMLQKKENMHTSKLVLASNVKTPQRRTLTLATSICDLTLVVVT